MTTPHLQPLRRPFPHRSPHLLALVAATALTAVPAHAWWDTQIMALKEVPKVAEIEAEAAMPGHGATIIADAPAFGPLAGGGKAVVLGPGAGTLTWKLELKRSVYKLFAMARVPEAEPHKNGSPEWPIFARLRVTGPAGQVIGDWSMPINYLNSYYDTARLFFPAHADGTYILEFSLAAESKAKLTVDRLELRDELGNTLRKGFKSARYLHTDAEIAQMRQTFRAKVMQAAGAADDAALKAVLADPAKSQAAASAMNAATSYRYGASVARVLPALAAGPILPGREPNLDPAKRAERLESFRQAWGTGYESWNTPDRGKWEFKGVAENYLETGDPELALAAAQTLIRAADWYPALDWSTQVREGVGNYASRGIRFTFTAGRFGKWQYSGWEIGFPDSLARMYDAVFPFLLANADELVAMAQVRLPWVKTRDDLIALLDTQLLQYTGDCVHRDYLRCSQGGSELMMLPCIAVQGPNPAGERLARWLYTRTYWDTTNDGGIQDQAVSGRLRDGANNIGSISYTEAAGSVLVAAASLMQRYIAAGGSREFDLSDATRFPAVLAGAFFPLECRVAGGYHPRIGDWGRAMDPRINKTLATFGDSIRFAFANTRDPRLAWLLKNEIGRGAEPDAVWADVEKLSAPLRDPQLAAASRNLEGFGLAILEAGTDRDDFTRKRALTFRHGAGKGHAHADSLGLEFFAHGVRALPDTGNRGGSPHPGHMNCHLGVTVDGGIMRNTAEVNVSGTAWTTAFKSVTGTQYVSGAARFAATPQVSRYERQAALIDIDGQDASYVFDVLRVAGGQVHVWSTHGPARTAADAPSFNVPLKPAVSAEAKAVLAAHLAPQEGVAATTVAAAWPMAREFEQRMLEGAFKDGLPPLFTRSLLFGHTGDGVFTGDSDPQAKGLEGSQWLCTVGLLHVRRAGDAGLQTVWPQLLESYRGDPLIRAATALPVTPADTTAAAPVALAIETVSGQKDTLLADGDGTREVQAGDMAMVGRFAMVSRDAKGIRLAHLVGGTRLECAGLKIVADRAGYAATITAVDYPRREFTLDQPLPARILNGEEFLTGAPQHPQVWKSVKVEGHTVSHALSAILYQSEILSVDAAAGDIICSMNPNMLLADPHYYDGVTAVAEAGNRSWRVRGMVPKYIWMYLQEPLQDWRETFSDQDFPDADGDGRRTVTISNWGGGDGSPAIEKLVVEVAFVDAQRQVVYFKLPDNPEVVKANGWQWAGSRLMDPAKGRWMSNEVGRRWIPNYTGKQNVIQIEGKVTDGYFTDADKDGRRLLRLYHFGAGDRVTLQSHVCVRRQADGGYTVEGATPATVTLPDGQVRK